MGNDQETHDAQQDRNRKRRGTRGGRHGTIARRLRARIADLEAEKAAAAPPPQPSTSPYVSSLVAGVEGGLSTTGSFDRRKMALDIKQILEFGGTIKPEDVEALLLAGAKLAAYEASVKNTRNYRAGMSVLLTAAKMQMELDKRTEPGRVGEGGSGVQVTVQTGDSQVAVYLPDNGRERKDDDIDNLDDPDVLEGEVEREDAA